MESAFSSWIGRSVVLRVALGDSRVGVRGRLIKDGAETLKMRLIEGLDIDIYKEMVLAVEEDPPLFLMS
jgi:RNase P/RNase MRP subunit p29